MDIILNIETSSDMCSVALTSGGGVLFEKREERGMNHAKVLAPFIEECMNYLANHDQKLSAVAVSIGPGSYTGLRIGLSTAKGICFGKDIPLIGISTLEIMAVSAMFRKYDWEGDELLVPMLDARRMEVYTGVYDFALNPIIQPQPHILSEESFKEYLDKGKLYFMGSGSIKAMEVIKSPNAMFMNRIVPNAVDMMALSERAFKNKQFLDLAYSVPKYLKEFQATTPKNKI